MLHIFGQSGSSSPYKWLCHSAYLPACLSKLASGEVLRDDLKNNDDLKNEDDLKNADNLKTEDNLNTDLQAGILFGSYRMF